ncbi:helix-turn-helix transcriptional regulator [Alicyclobacillus kakegawensis]|uniref:helix-turn-helix transcriptional regulator n=1 Tax=Alicyclobacillus kakegawensis TaxID=392012 RepID=UPI0008339E6D|nr:YafY family protein [Alicyclobacillus kakegawensis]
MRADRLLGIIMSLRTEGRLTAREMARRFEVSERTIYRDIDALSGMGVPIFSAPGVGGGFTLSESFQTQIDGLTTAEVQALFTSLSKGSLQELGIDQALQTAFIKLLHALPEHKQAEAKWIQGRIYLDSVAWSRDSRQTEFVRVVQQAVWTERQVEIIYHPAHGDTVQLTVQPYGLVCKAGIWFMVGPAVDSTVKGIHAYRISRIETVRLTETRFQRPGGFDLQTFWEKWVAAFDARRSQYRAVPPST